MQCNWMIHGCYLLYFLFIYFHSCYLYRYTNLEDSSDLVSQKRTSVSLIFQEKKKKRKVHKPEVLVIRSVV
jgi:hypothetical protein